MTEKKKTDRRTLRTKHRLSQAMVGLVKEKRFDDITVQDLIDRADIGRATFYTHFRDKEDMLQKDWERFLDGLAAQINWENAGKTSFVPVVFLFAHLQDFHRFYQGLVRSRKAESSFRDGAAYLSRKLETALDARAKHKTAIPTSILATFLASELFVLLKWWLDQGMPYTPEQMDEIYHKLVTPAVQNYFAG
ncbi:MAG TPA: TetR/AcrR family transcriptional regulator [Pyrinomonadaceae bacterium]|nr:TetR/AcrR family transcriptional regulator [Pyrinomonadaceae bacterium]